MSTRLHTQYFRQYFRLHSRAVLLLTLTCLYYGGGRTFVYGASSQPSPVVPSRAVSASGAPSSAVEGTGSIQGEVVDSVTGAPVARARVGVMPLAGRRAGDDPSSQAITDADGKFVFERLPAGAYAWWVRKAGYLGAPVGGQPTLRGMANSQIVVSAGQVLRHRVSMAPASVMLGRVLAPDREPVEGARLSLFRVTYPGAAPRRVDSLEIETNDAGEFRIAHLAPGSYMLHAYASSLSNWGDGGTVVATWYPGAASVADATPIEVTRGSVVTGLDITMQDVKLVTVAGTVLDRNGRPATSGTVKVISEREGVRMGVPLAAGSDQSLESDGAFRLRLPPGEYGLMASTHDSGGIGSISLAAGEREPSPEEMRAFIAAAKQEIRENAGFAYEKVNVGGDAIEGLTLKLEPPITINGRVVFEGREPAPDALMYSEVRLAAADEGGCQGREVDLDVGREPPSGTFEIFTTPGTCIAAVTPPPGWYVKAIELGGADVTQRSMTLEPGQSPGDMRVILTDRRNAVSFNVVDARGNATKAYVAIVFPVNESLWSADRLRRLHVPRAEGAARDREQIVVPTGPYANYSEPIAGIAPGEYYAIAVDDAAWEDLAQPAMLRRLSEKAMRFRIAEGETRMLDLRRIDLASF